MTEAALLGSAVVGAVFVVLGLYGFVATGLPGLSCFTLLAIGGLGLVLAERARHRRRAPWAYLIAMWGVVAFCGFFTAPQVLSLQSFSRSPSSSSSSTATTRPRASCPTITSRSG